MPRLRRRRAGRGFAYTDDSGSRLGDTDIQRIRSLASPRSGATSGSAPTPDRRRKALEAAVLELLAA